MFLSALLRHIGGAVILGRNQSTPVQKTISPNEDTVHLPISTVSVEKSKINGIQVVGISPAGSSDAEKESIRGLTATVQNAIAGLLKSVNDTRGVTLLPDYEIPQNIGKGGVFNDNGVMQRWPLANHIQENISSRVSHFLTVVLTENEIIDAYNLSSLIFPGIDKTIIVSTHPINHTIDLIVDPTRKIIQQLTSCLIIQELGEELYGFGVHRDGYRGENYEPTSDTGINKIHCTSSGCIMNPDFKLSIDYHNDDILAYCRIMTRIIQDGGNNIQGCGGNMPSGVLCTNCITTASVQVTKKYE